jgi:hypothetical protein
MDQPSTYRIGDVTLQQVQLIDGSHLVFNPELGEWRHDPA